MTVLLLALGIMFCLIASAFFSASEMAYSSCNTLRLENLEEEGSRRARAARYITEHFDKALSTILIGNNLVNIASSSLASVLMILLLGSVRGAKYAWVSTAVLTILVIICGETIPKITAKKNANRFALSFAYPIRVLMVLLFPAVWLVVSLIRLLTLPLKSAPEDEDQDAAVDELQKALDNGARL